MVENQMEQMIGQIGNFGRKVNMGRKMNAPDGALHPWSCFKSIVSYISESQAQTNLNDDANGWGAPQQYFYYCYF